MTQHPFGKALAILLTVTLIAPSVFLIAPEKAHAIPVSIIADPVGWPAQIKTAATTAYSLIKETLIEVHDATSAAANYATYVNQYVLQPLAFVMSVGLLKAMTAGVIAFVIGDSNGTGQSQFVKDVDSTLQKVGDIKAQAFFLQFGKNSNSPFAASITSSLRTNYLQQTSLAGFWASQKCTLAAASPNINAFLAGKWSQGGTRAWLALTTEPQNNPYTLYQTSQSQLAAVTAAAQETRSKVLSWGQGIMSWCGESDSKGNANSSTPDPNAGANGAACDFSNPGEQDGTWQGGHCVSNGTHGSAAINPGDPCLQSDGTAGVMKTPGSTIKSTLDKVLGSTQDVLSNMGALGKEVNSIMQDVGTVFQTVNLAQSILGGTGSGGLAGFGSSSGGSSSSGLSTYNRSAFLGVTPTTVYQNAAADQTTTIDTMTTRITQYEKDWGTIRASAQVAATALTDLASVCSEQSSATQAALTSAVNPLLARAADAATAIATARGFVAKIQTEMTTAIDVTSQAALQADLQQLQTMSPTVEEAITIQQETTITPGAAQASESSPFAPTGGTLIDQMNLLTANVAAAKYACTYVPSSSSGQESTGG